MAASDTVDAVVIGAGHHGLVAASMLADAGWDVLVLEAQQEPGGAVRSAELTPGYITDLFSSFYPMTVASPAIAALHLEDHGLRWSHAPAVVGHPLNGADEDPPVIYHDPARTAAEFARRQPADGDNWHRAVELWDKIKAPLMKALLAPFPPMLPLAQLLAKVGTAEAIRLANLLVQPANTMADRLFDGEAPKTMLLGNALHADIPLDAPGSGVMGFLMCMLAQDTGWPVPVGGSGQLTAALVSRATSAGARIEYGQNVSRIQVRGGRAVGVNTDGGRAVTARRAVIADVTAPQLFCDMLPADALPSSLLDDLRHYVWDPPVVKVNYALDGLVPWRAKTLHGARFTWAPTGMDWSAGWLTSTLGWCRSVRSCCWVRPPPPIPPDRPRAPKVFGPIRICRATSTTTTRQSSWPRPWTTSSRTMRRASGPGSGTGSCSAPPTWRQVTRTCTWVRSTAAARSCNRC